MYWPWSFRLARRAGESLSLRPRRAPAPGSRFPVSTERIRLTSDRAIDFSDRRIAWTSLSSDRARGLLKCASKDSCGLGRRVIVHRVTETPLSGVNLPPQCPPGETQFS